MAAKTKKKTRRPKKVRKRSSELISLPKLMELLEIALREKDPEDLNRAEKHLHQWHLRDPDQTDILHYLGMVQYHQGARSKGVDLIRKSIEMNPDNYLYHYNLGTTQNDDGEPEKAARAFVESIKLNSEYPLPFLELGKIALKKQDFPAAIPFFLKVLELDPNFPDTYLRLGLTYLNLQHKEKALKYFSKYVELRPGDESAKHLFMSLKGENAETIPEDYVSGVFDGYAENFEAHLGKVLGYDAPALLRKTVGRIAGEASPSWKIIDLGCGTGLCGANFRDMASELIGVDLSQKMLEKAKEKEVYDQLHHTDITDALKSHDGDLDLAVSADVFIYVGDLDGVFQGCAGALREGGLLAFTTESFSGEGFFLRQSARFAHSPEYIQSLADKYGFSVLIQEDIILRFEVGKPLSGHIFVLSKGVRARNVANAEVSVEPGQIDEALDKALAHHEAGHLAEAEKLYRAILEIDRDNANALHFLGVIEFQRGNLDEASGLIFRAIEKLPDIPSFHNNLALVRQEQGRLEAAAESLRKAVELEPAYTDALNNLGIVCKKLGRLDEAADCLERLIKSVPTYPEARNNLGNIYMEQGRLDEAVERYEAAVAQNSEFPDAVRNLAKARLVREEYTEAEELFRRLLKLAPGDTEAEAGLAECQRLTGNAAR